MKKRIVRQVISALPMFDNVFVLPDPVKTETDSGILIPEIAQEEGHVGYVVAIGPGKKDEPMSLKVGDRVAFSKYSGTDLDWEGKVYKIMRETDIKALLNPAAEEAPAEFHYVGGLNYETEITEQDVDQASEADLSKNYETGVQGGSVERGTAGGFTRKLNGKPLPGLFDTSRAAVIAFQLTEAQVMEAQGIANKENIGFIDVNILLRIQKGEQVEDTPLPSTAGSALRDDIIYPEDGPGGVIGDKGVVGKRVAEEENVPLDMEYVKPPSLGTDSDQVEEHVTAVIGSEVISDEHGIRISKLHYLDGIYELWDSNENYDSGFFDSEALIKLALTMEAPAINHALKRLQEEIAYPAVMTEELLVDYTTEYFSQGGAIL